MGLSLLGTIVGVVAVAAFAHEPGNNAGAAAFGFGIFSVGPSIGEFYAGSSRRALIFSGARALCSGLFLYEFGVGHLGGEQPDRSAENVAQLALVGMLALTFTSIIDAAVAANDFNDRHRPPAGPGLTLAPLLAPSHSPAGAPVGLDAGLMLSGRF